MTTEDGRISANVFVKPKNIPDDTFLFEYSLFFISTLYDLNMAHPDIKIVKDCILHVKNRWILPLVCLIRMENCWWMKTIRFL